MSGCPGAFGVTLVLLLVAASCSAQDLPAACPRKNALTNFNATAYMGKWYEYAKFGDTPYEDGGVCVTAQYSLSNNNVTVVNSMVDNRTRERDQKIAWADFQGPDTVAKLSVHFRGAPVGGMYWVLSTDYDNYSIVWSCEESNSSGIIETSWILIRTNSITNATKETVEMELKKVDLPLDKYMMTWQADELCSGAAPLLAASLTLLVTSLASLLG